MSFRASFRSWSGWFFKVQEVHSGWKWHIPSDSVGKIKAWMPINGRETIWVLVFSTSKSSNQKILNIFLWNSIIFLDELKLTPRSKLKYMDLCESTVAKIEDLIAVRDNDFRWFPFDPSNSPSPKYIRMPLSYK